ncbi:FG-GAP repeat domain-containing protein [Glycomyces rhizosphaerae]|uniref:FG-GAP repeat domain-containing protein n=1 Tax=Glycomyces rhizosphaerae TaxID=2054422 RepID=A0ABV7Q198_9ACTN
MPPESLKRIRARVVAGAAIGLMIAGAFTAPASAEDPDSVESLAQSRRFDYNGDGFNDLVYVRKEGGKLYFRAGDGSGNYGSAQAVLSGFGKMDVVMAGDLNSDGFADLLTRDNKNGNLYTYPGDGAGGFGTRIYAGFAFYHVSVFTVLDYDGDGNPDLLSADGGKWSGGTLIHYPGKGDGTFDTGVQIADDLGLVDMLVSPGDVDRDGFGDFLVRIGPTQEYRLHLSHNEERVELGQWLGDPTQSRHYRQVVSAGDVDGNGSFDLLTTDALTGALYRQSFDDSGSVGGFTTVKTSGWNAYRLPAVVPERTYDYDMDGDSDGVAVRRSNDTSFMYSSFFDRQPWGSAFDDLDLVENAGDFTGDSRPDLIGRVPSTGALYLYSGNGVDYEPRVRIGTGWNAMDAILGGYDYNYDGKTDILAREKGGGTLWLYPGLGEGKIGARSALDTVDIAGLGRFSSIGDFNHDGVADLLAVNANDCLVFVAGQGGADYFKKGVELTCDWSSNWNALADSGDVDDDGHLDFVARDPSDGKLFSFRGDGKGGVDFWAQLSTGWQGFLIA